jgi:RNA polymerase sigma factor (sigma-70 family)
VKIAVTGNWRAAAAATNGNVFIFCQRVRMAAGEEFRLDPVRRAGLTCFMSHDNVASLSSTFERFLKAMGPKMKRTLAANHIPIEDAEDVLQQTLLALVYKWDSIHDPESYLLRTLRNNCFLYWRNHRRRLYSAVDSTLLELLSEPVAPPQERSDLLSDLRHMIERLPQRCRSLLELRFQLGYEPAEVARRLGYRDSSIGKVTNRCLAALAREMVGAAVGQAVPAAPLAVLEPISAGAAVAGAAPHAVGLAAAADEEECGGGPGVAPGGLPEAALPIQRLSPPSALRSLSPPGTLRLPRR